MYIFENLSDYHLTPELLEQNANEFMGLFSKALTDPDIEVKVSALKATSVFLSALEEQSTVMKF